MDRTQQLRLENSKLKAKVNELEEHILSIVGLIKIRNETAGQPMICGIEDFHFLTANFSSLLGIRKEKYLDYSLLLLP